MANIDVPTNVPLFHDCIIKLRLDNRSVDALVDTGATLSVIDRRIVECLELMDSVDAHNVCKVVGIGGNSVQTSGTLSCSVSLNEDVTLGCHTFHVVDNLCSGVLVGRDIISRCGLVIDIANNCVSVCNSNKWKWPLSLQARGAVECLVVQKNEHFAAGERKLIPVKIKGELSGEGCITPINTTARAPWRLAASINKIVDGHVYCDVVNLSSSPMTLSRSTKIAEWQPVHKVLMAQKGESDIDLIYDQLKIEELDLTTQQREVLKSLLLEYRDVFSLKGEALGFCDTIKHRIDVGDHPPIRQGFRRIHSPIKEQVEKELVNMEQQGVIEPSTSPWCSPMVPVLKKNGKIRICIDYRKLNSVTKFNSYPLPNIEDNLSQFNGAKYFSTLDLLSGYHQVALEESSKEKTAFATEKGLYQYTVMPQGACGSPATFQNLMNVVLAGMPTRHALAYLDDILVVGRTFEEHLQHLEEVLKRLKQHNLKLSVEKCNLFKAEVAYLGHVLTKEGIKPSLHNVEALQSLPAPRTVKELRRINGMINYYSKFVPNLATIMSPLYKMTTEKKLQWTNQCEDAFSEVKNILSSYPVLGYPRYGDDDDFILTTDGSGTGIGTVLSQKQDGKEIVLGYGSVSFSEAQRKYNTTERELAALRYGVRHFKPYIYGRKFTIRTDHQAILYLEQMKMVDSRLMRTYEDLQVGEFTIEYIPGIENVIADTLSRAPLPTQLTDDEMESPPEPPEELKFVAAGGPNSLFECLNWALKGKSGTPEELRVEVIEHVLQNLTRYGYENNSKDKKFVSSWCNSAVFVDHKMLQPFADLYACNVIVKYNPGPVVKIISRLTPNSEIVLECKGGVHYNVIQEETDMRCTNEKEPIVKVLFVLKDDSDAKVYNLERVLEESGSDLSNSRCPDTEQCSLDTSGPSDEDYGDNERSYEADKIVAMTRDEARHYIIKVHKELGHVGRSATLRACKNKISVKNLFYLVRDCVRFCEECQRNKTVIFNRNRQAPLYKLSSSVPGQVLALDLLDMGKKSRKGNKVLLVGIDTCTRFGYAIPIRNKLSKTVAHALESSILSSAVLLPNIIYTDSGPEFRGKPFKDLLRSYNIEHQNSIPYRPQSNAVVERFNGTLRNRLATCVNKDYSDWDVVVYKILVQYNRTPHSETNCSPVSFYSEKKEDPVLPTTSRITRQAGKNFVPYKRGDLVLCKIPFYKAEQRHKLAPIYEGPFKVIKCCSNTRYRIKDLQTTGKTKTVHFEQLRPYYGEPPRHPARLVTDNIHENTESERWVCPPMVLDEVEYVVRGDLTSTEEHLDDRSAEMHQPGARMSTPERLDAPRLCIDSNEISENVPDALPVTVVDVEVHAPMNRDSPVPSSTAPPVTENNNNDGQQESSEEFSGFAESSKSGALKRKLIEEIKLVADNCLKLAQKRKETTETVVEEIKSLPELGLEADNSSTNDFEGFEDKTENTRVKRVISEIQAIIANCNAQVDSILEMSDSSELRKILEFNSAIISVSLTHIEDSSSVGIEEIMDIKHSLMDYQFQLNSLLRDSISLNSNGEVNGMGTNAQRIYESPYRVHPLTYLDDWTITPIPTPENLSLNLEEATESERYEFKIADCGEQRGFQKTFKNLRKNLCKLKTWLCPQNVGNLDVSC